MSSLTDKKVKDIFNMWDTLFLDRYSVPRIKRLVGEFFGIDNHEKIDTWFSTSNPMLGNMAPNEMIKAGRSGKLLKWVEQQLYTVHLPEGGL